MKHTKTLTALLLTIALVFSLALPAAAAANWDEFAVTAKSQDMTVPHGAGFTINVQVNIPANAEVTYQWHREQGSAIAGATAPTLQLKPGDADYPQMPKATSGNTPYYRAERYYCEITATEAGTADTKTLQSGPIAVRVKNSLLEKLYSITFEPFVFAAMGTAGAFIWVGPLALTGTLYFLVMRYVENFKELFR